VPLKPLKPLKPSSSHAIVCKPLHRFDIPASADQVPSFRSCVGQRVRQLRRGAIETSLVRRRGIALPGK